MIQMVAFQTIPTGWTTCDGQLLDPATHPDLFALLGTTYGGNGITTFGLPNLQNCGVNGSGSVFGLSTYTIGQVSGEASHLLTVGEMAAHDHDMIGSSIAAATSVDPTAHVPGIASASFYATGSDGTNLSSGSISTTGGTLGVTQPHNNLPPQIAMQFIMAIDEATPADPDYVIGEVRMIPFAPPTNWLACNGAPVSRTTYADLFAAIGTTHGIGDGSTTFNVPNMCGRVPVHMGQGTGLSLYTLGQTGGTETVALAANQLPVHQHFLTTAAGRGGRGSNTNASSGNTVASGSPGFDAMYSIPGSPVTMHADAVRPKGSGTGHENRAPQVAMQYAIAYSL